MAPPPRDILLDNNLLVATGMAICKSVMQSVCAVNTLKLSVTMRNFLVILYLWRPLDTNFTSYYFIRHEYCSLPRHTISTTFSASFTNTYMYGHSASDGITIFLFSAVLNNVSYYVSTILNWQLSTPFWITFRVDGHGSMRPVFYGIHVYNPVPACCCIS